MHTIRWQLKAEVMVLGRKATIYESPNLFTATEAQRLAKVANSHFTRANHWVESAQSRNV